MNTSKSTQSNVTTPTVFVQIDCIMCGETHMLEVPLEGYNNWRRGERIQDALPELTPDERELLISRICGKCFDKIFSK